MTKDEAFEQLRQYVVAELELVLSEMRVPMNTGLIAESKIRHLQAVLAAWPDVTIPRQAFGIG